MKRFLIRVILLLVLASSLAWSGASFFYSANLDFPLYKNESYWGGSKQAELASFIDGGYRVMRAQMKIASQHGGTPARVFHAKQHGCLTGKLNLFYNRSKDIYRETYEGLFDAEKKSSYDVIVRFSNGVGFAQEDALADVRGVAIKIFDVENNETHKNQTVDLLMTNSPTPFGKDFLEFARFMELVANHGPNLGGALFGTHVRASLSLLKATGLPTTKYKVKSLLTERYWSGHPYLLGSDKAMKFNIVPTMTDVPSRQRIEGWNQPDYLSFNLNNKVFMGPVKFKFMLQLEKSLKETPIEDNLVEWTEKISPSIEVGELVLDQQSPTHQINQECQELRFTPAHYIPANRPLSNMGRGRIFGYEASQIGRHAAITEPDSSMIKRWRDQNAVRSN